MVPAAPLMEHGAPIRTTLSCVHTPIRPLFGASSLLVLGLTGLTPSIRVTSVTPAPHPTIYRERLIIYRKIRQRQWQSGNLVAARVLCQPVVSVRPPLVFRCTRRNNSSSQMLVYACTCLCLVSANPQPILSTDPCHTYINRIKWH